MYDLTVHLKKKIKQFKLKKLIESIVDYS